MGVFDGMSVTYEDTNREFTRLSAKYNNCFANVKYTAFRIITEGQHQTESNSEIVHNAHNWESLASAYGIEKECVTILEELKKKGLDVDDNIRKTDSGTHRKNKKRGPKNENESSEEKKVCAE